MARFSKFELNTQEWDGSFDLQLTRPYMTAVDIIGDPNSGFGGPYKIFLNPTQNISADENVE